MKQTPGDVQKEGVVSRSRAGAAEGYCSISELCRINERRDLGCLLLDSDGRVVFTSPLGHRLMQNGGLCVDGDGFPLTEDPDQQAALWGLFAAAGSSDPLRTRQVALRRRGVATPLVVRSSWVYFTDREPGEPGHPNQARPPRRVGRLGASDSVSDDAAMSDVVSRREGCILWLRDPSFFGPSAARELAYTFGLTPRESELVLHLARGAHLSQFAALHGVSINTVKSHLKQAFVKCGVKTQAQLVASVLGFLR